jgi:glucose-1-phosphate cytidylyltransferase
MTNNEFNKITVAILAGGYGTRLSEETNLRPKPMVKIGSQPILWHIIKHYEYYGFKNFIICLGYKGQYIKNYFKKNFNLFPNLKIKLVKTGLDSLTAKRILKIKNYLTDPFLLTYGDAVSNINLNSLFKFHIRKKSIFTISGVIPTSRYGSIKYTKKGRIKKFTEKKDFQNFFVNGGYFVVNKKSLKYFSKNKNQMLENEPIKKIVKTKKMFVYRHFKFWQCMDTLRDKKKLSQMWESNPPWKIWNDL